MNVRRIGAGMAAGGALVALGLGVASPAMAEDATVSIVPAPAGQAEAVAVKVGDIVAIGHTAATAGPSSDGSDSSATADAVELGGAPPSKEFGGTQKGKGSSKGALVDTGDTPLGRLQVAPWSATVAGDATSASPRTSDASAALARLVLVNSGVLSVDVARSTSHASHDGYDSAASASSDGAVISGANAITLVVLHAERSSDGKGSTYLVGINGQKIGTDEQLSQCPLGLDPLGRLSVNCVSATGGPGGLLTTTAQVAGATLGSGQLSAQAVSAGGSSAKGSSVVPASPAAEAPAYAAIDDGSASRGAPVAPFGGSLPRTGAAGAGALSLLGVSLAAGGEVLRRFGRGGRRRVTA